MVNIESKYSIFDQRSENPIRYIADTYFGKRLNSSGLYYEWTIDEITMLHKLDVLV